MFFEGVVIFMLSLKPKRGGKINYAWLHWTYHDYDYLVMIIL